MKVEISRRMWLRGAGVSIALPILAPSVRANAERDPTPERMLLISNNLGVLPGPFFPSRQGSDYDVSPYLSELQEFRDRFTVFSGLSHPEVIGGHSTENCFLTAARGPTKSGFRNQISLDQFASEALGQPTRFATLNLGVNIDKAKRSLSWTRDGALLPAEDSPAALFQRMFVQGDQRAVRQRLHELSVEGSILDTVSSDAKRLRRSLGVDDRKRVEQYLHSIRDLEQRFQIAGEWTTKPKPATTRQPPEDITDQALIFEKFEQMLSMAALAFESDSTRIITLMVDAFDTGVFQIDGSTKSINAYHNLSHHGNVPEKVAQLETVDRRQMRLLSGFLKTLHETSDGSSSLLDRTMVLYGSNMGDANTHDNTNLPILLAGGGLRHGHHLAFDSENNKPLSNLFVTMLQRMGIDCDAFGSSNGNLNEIL